MYNFLSELKEKAVDLIYPASCQSCSEPIGNSGALCVNCWQDLTLLTAPQCRYCGTAIELLETEEIDDADMVCTGCLHFPVPWSLGRAATLYDGTAKNLVLALKHMDRLDNSKMMAGLMAHAGKDVIASSDCIIPVPLHWTRRIKRRYNQSAELARWLHNDNLVFAPSFLQRTRMTQSQGGKNRHERLSNMQDAFNAKPDVMGKSVLIVDDVMTTGATLSACTEALYNAGAKNVNVLIFARVDQKVVQATLNGNKYDEGASDG